MILNNNLLGGGNGAHKTFFHYPPSIPFTFQVWREGNTEGVNYFTSYNWNTLKNSIPTTNAYYVDPISGNNANPGTIGSPLKSVLAALQKTDRDIIYLKPGIYNYTEGWVNYNLSTIARPLHLTTYGGAGNAIISTAYPHTFSSNATYPGVVYESAAVTDINTTTVVDLTNTETINGTAHARRLVRVASIALCNSTLNSSYYDSVADILYVHTFDTRPPDSDIICLRNVSNAKNDGKESIYIENIEFWGGGINPGVFYNINTTGTLQTTVLVNCAFKYSTDFDGAYNTGNCEIYGKNCIAYANWGDGLNYSDGSSYNTTALEYYCSGWRNGYRAGGAENGSTAHENCKIIRIAGFYKYNYNRNVHDINNVVSFNVGCVAGESLAPSDSSRVSFACGAEATPGNGTIGYYIECTSDGGGSVTDLACYQNTLVYVNSTLMRQTIIREGGSKLRQFLTANTFDYSREYQTYLDELTYDGITLPSDTEGEKDNNLITGLIADGEWNNIGLIRRYKGSPSLAASHLNLKYPGLYKGSAVNSPTFDSNGVGSNGTSSYINTNWNLFIDETLSRDNMSIGVWVSVGDTLSGASRMLCGSSTTIAIGEFSGVTNVGGRANDATTNEFTGSTNFANASYYSFRRTANNVLEFYVNGVLVNTVSTASTVNPSSSVLYVLARNNSGANLFSLSTWRIGAVVVGSGALDQLKIYNRLATRFI